MERGFSHGNGREIRGEISQIHNARNQQNRQEDEWSVPASIERRQDNTLRRELQRAPPTSPHSEDRLFTDWSSLDSPWTRTSPRNVSARDIEQNGNQPINQTIQSGSEPARIEVMGNTLCDNVTSTSTHQQPDQVDARFIDIGINTSEIEVISQRDEAEVIKSDDDNVQISCSHVKVTPPTDKNEQVHVPHINVQTSRYVPESIRDSHLSTYDIGTQETIPQLDGPLSVSSRLRGRRSSEHARTEPDFDPRTIASHRKEYPGDDSDDSHNDRRSYWDHRPPERGRSQGHNGRLPERRHHQSREYSGRDYTGQNGGPPDDGGPPDGGGPPDDGGSSDDGGPPNNGRP